MDPTAGPDPLTRLDVRLRRVTVVLGFLMIAVLLIVAFTWARLSRPDQLRLRTLTIVDRRGVERVRIGGQLPDAVVKGKRVPRGEEAAGVLIYDDAGQERGGYVTFAPSRNAVLTLDTRKGMVVLLAADSTEGAALRLWRGTFSDWLELRAGSTGAHLTVGRGNEVVLSQPPMSEADAATFCTELRSEISRLKVQPPVQEVLRACRQHMSGAACHQCLKLP
jgi:hypothetical protein